MSFFFLLLVRWEASRLVSGVKSGKGTLAKMSPSFISHLIASVVAAIGETPRNMLKWSDGSCDAIRSEFAY